LFRKVWRESLILRDSLETTPVDKQIFRIDKADLW